MPKLAPLSPSLAETIRSLVAEGLSAATIAAKYDTTKKIMLGYVARHKLGPWITHGGVEKRPVPDDFLVLGPDMPRDTAQKHYKCGAGTLQRWYKETGVIPSNQRRNRATLSEEEIELVSGMGIMEAAKALGINRDTASKMMHRAGLIKPPKPKEPKPRGKLLPIGTWKPVPVEYVRDMSRVGQAAEFLGKLGPVSRCDLHGKPMKDGRFWRRGSTILTDGEIVDRARSRGWSPVY